MILKPDNLNFKAILKIIVLLGITLLVVLNFSQIMLFVGKLYLILFPLFLGAGIAYVLNLLVVAYEKIYFPKSKHKALISTRRGIAVLLSLLTIAVVLLFFLRILIPQFAETLALLYAGFPAVYDDVMGWLNRYAGEFPGLQQQWEELNMDGTAALKNGLGLLGNWALGTVTLMGTVFGVVVNTILAIIFAIYILFSKEEIGRNIDKLLRAYMRPDHRAKIYVGLDTAHETFSNYIVGQGKEAVILGVLCTLGMWILGFPYATTVGPVVGLTALIPMVGAYLGAAVGFILILIVDPLQAVLFLVFIIILQQIEGNIIYPKVVGQSIGLPGIWVLVAVIIGGGLMGVIGIMLGVPTAATVYKLLSKDVNKRLQRLTSP
ncbi:MAG: AI-2E family transporter [Desulfitobacterium sp.]